MKSFVAVAAFAAGTNALVGRSDSCCFHLTSSGGLSGDLGQLDDGQVRIGDNSLSPASFCLDSSSGAITDSAGRGCVITSETTQFQCDEGASPVTGFSVSSSGKLEFNGSQDFVACQTGQNDGRNVYTTESADVTQCVNVQLTADSCSGSGSGSGASSSGIASSTGAASSIPMTPSSSVPVAPSSSTPVVPGSSVPVAPSFSVPAVPSSEASSGPGVESTPAATWHSWTPSPSAPADTSAPLPGPTSTVVNTVTVTDCSCSASSGFPGGGSSVPGESPAPSGWTSVATVAPSVPASSGGAQPSGPAGGSSSVPTAPTSSPPGGSQQPSGSASVPASSASSTPSSTGSSSGSCPTDLSGDYEYPHLIIPIDSSSPDTAAGTSFNGTVTSTVSSVFNFDIPSSDSGKTCSLVFLFPELQDLETSSYSFSGDGKIDFAKLSEAASSETTYNNVPSVEKDLGDITVSPGNSYVVSTFSCPAGETVAYEMKNAGSTELNFFEDYNPSPLGLYITVC
ncbi:hypothetical protein N7532_009514 [Penicillium argentinense]|uniref:Ubiquitin 3 binding protein But2 C-terminal domain-containing protein n=1 Tax=Penicillium argentinense TaxID=1131581 RepID=A0A9W9EZJ2_9EURO|nr:uncharacterized protein N7532_009514 [Penicillium argentinense]KAJ5090830.1 hypothetical protein N7532_009514 [Penicillium argentinense]